MAESNGSGAVGLLAHRQGDAVAVAVRDLEPGDAIVAYLDAERRDTVTVSQEVPLGHKVALADVAEGAEVVEYGERIGLASRPITKGEHVHIHNLRSARWQPAS